MDIDRLMVENVKIEYTPNILEFSIRPTPAHDIFKSEPK